MNLLVLKLNVDKTDHMIYAPKHHTSDVADVSLSFGCNIDHNATVLYWRI